MRTPTAKRPDGRLARARALDGSIFAAAAERVHPLPWGRALSHSAVPVRNDLNAVRVESAAPDLTAAALAATAERLDLRQVVVGDEATAERLLPELEAARWTVHRTLLMAHYGPPPEPADGVEEVDPGTLEPLRAEWLRSEHELARHPAHLAQILTADRLIWDANPTRGFCRRFDGRPVTMALLIEGDARTAMVEDVYTTPDHRGRGHAASVVRAAVAAAYAGGADLVFLPTDADGLAQLLYRRLGFAPIGVTTSFVRPT